MLLEGENNMKVLGYILFVLFIGFCVVAGLDREQARQDYLKVINHEDDMVVVDNCIFDFNCDYYNNMLKGE